MRGITICVGYDDLLRITLVRNMRHLTECWVVTAPHDLRTQLLCESIPGVKVFVTDAFYRHGAKFNKGLAMEEGFEAMGREGWIVIWDADTLFPDYMPLPDLKVGVLYSPKRLILEDPSRWHPMFNWGEASQTTDLVFAGYFQLFNAADPRLVDKPWYAVDYIHCGGGDFEFQNRWPVVSKQRPAFYVLHLGPRDKNWFGRTTERLDNIPLDPDAESRRHLMSSFRHAKGWEGLPPSNSAFPERIEIPQ